MVEISQVSIVPAGRPTLCGSGRLFDTQRTLKLVRALVNQALF